MNTTQHGIQYINEQLFMLASDPDQGARCLEILGASPEIADRIMHASARAVSVAIRCSVPLIVLTSRVEELALLPPSQWRAHKRPEQPTELTQLAYFELAFAHSLYHRQSGYSQAHFGLSLPGAEALGKMGLVNVMLMSQRFDGLVKLRAGDNMALWENILIGERCEGAPALQIAQGAAILSL